MKKIFNQRFIFNSLMMCLISRNIGYSSALRSIHLWEVDEALRGNMKGQVHMTCKVARSSMRLDRGDSGASKRSNPSVRSTWLTGVVDARGLRLHGCLYHVSGVAMCALKEHWTEDP
jgi:hypothetical protein